MSQVVNYQEAESEIQEQPRARSGLLRRLWEGLGIPKLLDQLGIGKYSGLSAAALLFVYALFGAANARSIQHLVALAGEEFNKKDQPTRRYGLVCTDPDYPDDWCIALTSSAGRSKKATEKCVVIMASELSTAGTGMPSMVISLSLSCPYSSPLPSDASTNVSPHKHWVGSRRITSMLLSNCENRRTL